MSNSSFQATYDTSLDEIVKVFRDGLKGCFESVDVKVVTCPDLTKPPFSLLKPGLCGRNIVCDVGSMSNLLPVADKSKKYTFDRISELSTIKNGLIIGAGAGPFHTHGKNCEMAVNVKFDNMKITSNNTLHGIYDETTKTPQVVKATDNKFALLANLLSSEGLPGQVIEVDLRGRLKEGAAYVFLREALTAAFGKLDKPVAVGGVFVLNDSKGRFHVLPEFPDHPVDSPARVAEFLKFFEMEPPVLGMGTLVSHDPYKLGLKLEHFHCYNEVKKQAGHFYWDTETEEAHYRFYLTPASGLLRVDAPVN